MKLYRRRRNTSQLRVAPFAGAWIEIEWHVGECFLQYVAPFAGAWIEIHMLWCSFVVANVAPFAGAWIEIQLE